MITGPDNIKNGLVFYFDAANTKSIKFRDRIYNYTIWENGQTGGIGSFGAFSTRNRRLISDDPWGNQVVVWESYNVAGSTKGGGIYMTPISIDNTKMYRMSWWERRVSNGDATFARYYAGLNGYGSTNGVLNRDTGNNETNPYFTFSSAVPTSSQLPLNEWVLVVGHVWPEGSGTGSNHVDSGLYTINSGKISNISRADYVWRAETTTARSRTLAVYQPNATVTDMVIHHSVYPRLDIVDGSEPSLDDLLNNRTDISFDLSNNGNNGNFINGPTFELENKGSLKFDGANDSIRIPFDASSMDFSSAQTICMWLKPGTGANSLRRNPYNQAYGGSGTLTHETNGTINYYFGTNGGNSTPYVGRGSTFTVGIDELAFISVTRDQSTNACKWYKNGQLISTQNAGGYVSTANGSSDIIIGDGYTNPFIGDIFSCQVYNTALTDEEILKNYNATKSRFGL